MTQNLSADDLLIADIKPDLLRRIEEGARLSGRRVEDEAAFLLERGLTLDPDEIPLK